jgi:hypothetical protein
MAIGSALAWRINAFQQGMQKHPCSFQWAGISYLSATSSGLKKEREGLLAKG